MFCTTQMTIRMYKVNLYMKYQSAVEILSILRLLPENAFKHCIRQRYTTKTSPVTPIFIAILDPT